MKSKLSPFAWATSTAGMTVWFAVATFPFLWMFLISFRKAVDAFATPPKLFAPSHSRTSITSGWRTRSGTSRSTRRS